MQTATVRDLLDHMLARTVDSLGAHAGVLVLPEPGTDVLVVDASVGLPPGVRGPAVPHPAGRRTRGPRGRGDPPAATGVGRVRGGTGRPPPPECATPGEVLSRTNRLLTDLDPDLLTSCLYAHIDIARHRAYLATAGHCPPLLRPEGRPSDVLHLPPGPPLGVDPSADHPTTEVPFPPGTLLAVFTDGLVEIPGKDFDTNITELTSVLSDATGPLDGIADALLGHAQPSGHRTDDTALLLNVETRPEVGSAP